MRHRPALAAAALTAGLLAPGTAAAAPPRAVVVPCGAVLTTSVRLAADVACPGGTGITLAADGVELNLNGHRLTGPDDGSGTVGVRVAARDVVVRNGTVAGWGTGVLAGTDPYGEPEQGPVGGVVRQVRAEGNGTGVEVRFEGALAVRDSRLVGNGAGAGALYEGRLLVEGSTADRNGTGLHSFQVGWDGLVVRDSTVRGSRGAGVYCNTDGHAVLERTTVQRNTNGFGAFLCHARISGSDFRWNGEHVDPSTYLVDGDFIEVTCTRFTRDGGPLPFEAEPCGTGGRVSGTILPREPEPVPDAQAG
ncbi:hypothetical protein GTR00_08550 [Kineococcus sp. T90]|nr:hypothetical protein [Kineococcus indalonis]